MSASEERLYFLLQTAAQIIKKRADLRQQKSAITTMADRLEKAGYITKQRSDTDKRSWDLNVTKQGMAAYQRIREPVGRLNAVVDDILKEKRVAALAKDLRDLIKAFG